MGVILITKKDNGVPLHRQGSDRHQLGPGCEGAEVCLPQLLLQACKPHPCRPIPGQGMGFRVEVTGLGG